MALPQPKLPDLSEEELGLEIARQSLAAFGRYMWDGYLAPDHVIEICNHLEAVARGEIKRLIVVAPPRHSKSLNMAANFPPWILGNWPDKKIIYATYGQDLADDFGRVVRNTLMDPYFRHLFPNCHASEDTRSMRKVKTDEGGAYNAVGRNKAVAGKGADILIIDDILKDHKEAESDLIRSDMKDWYKSVAMTRLQKDGRIVIGGTRWHEDDLIGYAKNELKDQDWVELVLPARDKKRNPLWPEMFSDAALKEIEDTIGTYFWNALYMGSPTSREGDIYKEKNWRFYDVLPPRFDEVIQSWDATFKKTKSGSYVVGQVWGRLGINCYLMDQFRERMGIMKTIQQIGLMSIKYPQANRKLIEDKANGPAIIELMQSKIAGIKPIDPEGDKTARAHAVSYVQESGNLYLPNPATNPWVRGFVDEHTAFDKGRYDDQVDAQTQAVSYFMSGQNAIKRLHNLIKTMQGG
ncbi:MAG: phage terminase large subunit [Deltaproteobacteria bacterium]|nr:phage terminase large subunit [Deltaproteobacteria bacterium]